MSTESKNIDRDAPGRIALSFILPRARGGKRRGPSNIEQKNHRTTLDLKALRVP